MDDRETAALLGAQDQILILTHRRPDGDTIGCAAGLCTALRAVGKTAWVLENTDATSLFTPYLEGYVAPAGFLPSFVVSVDIASVGLLPKNALPYLERGIDLAIDHHGSNEGFAKANWVDSGRAACGELVYDIVRQWGPVSKEAALPLYAAVATDTGCFVYSNTTAQTHMVAAALMETGIDYIGVNKRHFRTKSMKRLRLESMLTENMELFDDGAVAVGVVTLAMMDRLDAQEEDAEDISAFVGQVEGVHTAVTIRELRPRECKLSVRTSGHLNASAICAQLGGGGHVAAGGCTVFGTVDEAKKAIVDAIHKVQYG
jgi:phosphoesterase RecJ-like protein